MSRLEALSILFRGLTHRPADGFTPRMPSESFVQCLKNFIAENLKPWIPASLHQDGLLLSTGKADVSPDRLRGRFFPQEGVLLAPPPMPGASLILLDTGDAIVATRIYPCPHEPAHYHFFVESAG